MLLSVCLDIAVMGRGNPVGLCIGPFAQGDLEVGVHGVADIPVGGPLIGFSVPFDGGLKPLDLIFKGEDCEAMDLFMILDSLDQTGGNFSECFRVDIGIGGEYVFHSTR